jgi:hypothetical protein
MRTLRVIAGGLLTLCGALTAHAQSPFEGLKTYSATIETSASAAPGSQAPGTQAPASQAAGPQGQREMKIYRSGELIRTNLPGGLGYSIVDLSEHTSFMVMGNGMCMQMSTQPEETPLSHSPDATIQRVPVGTETVDGHPCKVENLTITPHSGPRAGQATTAKVWEAQDLHGFPIKMESQTSRGAVTIQYKDISLSAPDASLFVHPEGCRTMPSMQGMPGMPGMPAGPPGAGPH